MSTIQCHSCGTALHAGDEYNQDGCPICGGAIHSPEKEKELVELEELAITQESKAPF